MAQKYATIIYTFGKYLLLLIFPHPLTHDYYPYQIPKVSFDNIVVVISVIVNVALFIYAIYTVYTKKNRIAFGLLFYFITFSVVSQVFFTVGTTMNERFVFMPSLGIVIAFVLLLQQVAMKFNIKMMYIVFGIVLIYSSITIARNPVWKTDATLFLHDIEISKNSAKLNLAVGGVLIDSANTKIDTVLKKQMLTSAIEHLKKAIEIYGDSTLLIDNEEIHIGYANAYNLLGNAYYFLNADLKNAEKAYKMADYYNPGHFDSYQNLVTIFYNEHKFAESIPLLKTLIYTEPTNANFNYKLGDAFKNTNNFDSAIIYYTKSIQLDPKTYEVLSSYQIGLCYARYKNDIPAGIPYLTRACQLDPNNINCNEDLGVAYAMSGKPKEAITYLKNCLRIQQNYQNAILNISSAYMARGMIDSAIYYKLQLVK
jgi:tetratricopeptide (TPR) repeat protein